MADVGYNRYRNETIGITTTLIFLSTSSFILRLLGRRISAVGFWYDDAVVGAALIFCWCIAVCSYVGLSFGFGHHASELSEEDVQKYTILLYIYFQLESAAVALIKTGILLFYWRVFANKKFRYCVYVVEFLVLSTYFIGAFGFAFQCTPASFFWNRKQEGHCIDQKAFDLIASLFFLFTDIVIYVMPMPIVWGLNTTKRRKWELTAVFVMGGIVCITGIIRLWAISKINPFDITYSNVSSSMWNMVESELGMVAANIPSMRPLLKHFSGEKSTSNNSNQGYGYAKNSLKQSSSRQTFGLSSKPPGFERMHDYKNGAQAQVSTMAKSGRSDSDDMELYDLTLPKHGITVRTDVEQHTHEVSDGDSLEQLKK